MPKFSEAFGLCHGSATLDFVDIELSTDVPLFIDPYAIEIRQDSWSDFCGDHIRSFFSALLENLRSDRTSRVGHLLGNLHEPNETHLGVSIGTPSGRGVGTHKAALLARAMINSRAFQTGVLSDIAEAELFIEGVGRDTISDLTTNLIRGPLAAYTKSQCELHNISTVDVGSIGPIWDIDSCEWRSQHLGLPIYCGRPLLLVPKFSVRQHLSIESQEFYNFHMIEYLRDEHLNSASGLVRTLRNGKKIVYKKDVKSIHPFVKDHLADFVRDHPSVLENYKNIKGSSGPLNDSDISADFNESDFAASLISEIQNVEAGSDSASKYHSLSVGICTFLFYPNLIYPVKEYQIHEGRKRIDIKYTNSAQEGFFCRIMSAPQTRALSVYVECKNYTKNINNPELDQMSGRFGPQRGFFGLVLCRNMDDRARIVSRCRDTVNDQRGYIIVLEDADIIEMLKLVKNGQRDRVDSFLQRRLDEISH